MITIMITQFSKVIEYDYDYTTKVIDYNYDYNESGLCLIICYNIINFNIIFFSLLIATTLWKLMGMWITFV